MGSAVEPPVESPRDLAAAYALLAAPGGPWRPVAGGTDLMVQLAGDQAEPPERVLDIWGLDELRGISLDGDVLDVGALVTYAEIRDSAVIAEFLPALVACAATIGAAQIQNRGTIGGNVVNASPAGDTLPILLATGTTFVLGSAAGTRSVPADAFWTGYRTTERRDDELLLRIRIPVGPAHQVRMRKVGTRRAQAISKVVMALAWRGEDGEPWTDVRLALGSVAATTIRAAATERVLEAALPSREVADAAAAALADELDPIDDVRSTADYRRAVAGRVLHRLIRDEGGW
jgi:CO/xanthine dehydrogenase FAD-binding subunit